MPDRTEVLVKFWNHDRSLYKGRCTPMTIFLFKVATWNRKGWFKRERERRERESSRDKIKTKQKVDIDGENDCVLWFLFYSSAPGYSEQATSFLKKSLSSYSSLFYVNLVSLHFSGDPQILSSQQARTREFKTKNVTELNEHWQTNLVYARRPLAFSLIIRSDFGDFLFQRQEIT